MSQCIFFLFPDTVMNIVTVSIQGGHISYGDIFSSKYVEIYENGVRFGRTTEGFTECYGLSPSGTLSSPTTGDNTDNCNYSDAHLYNGWGWDAVASQSCPPLSEEVPGVTTGTHHDNDCVYASAEQNKGWGWDPVSLQSCPPLSEYNTGGVGVTTDPVMSTDDYCDYSAASDNDGWGWNPMTLSSCEPRL